MLARKLKLTLNGLGEVGTTPMLVPSVSSRTNKDISEILTIISEIVYGPILISAYDWYYYKKKIEKELNLTFPNLIFLDSGGYERNKDQDVSDIGLYKPDPLDWDEKLYLQVIKEWSTKIPTVLISLDLPSKRDPIKDQIKEARNLFRGNNTFIKEILIKPQSKSSERINKEAVIRNLKSLSKFDILGFTEKDLGFSLLDRMTNLAKIRMAMDDERIEKPIHIFGSLDPITTPLYYMAGADIFDGLSWLRFIFHNGETHYIDSFGPKRFGIHENVRPRYGKTVGCNYTYLMRLQLDLEKFQSEGDFKVFGSNADFFKKAFDDLSVKIGGDHNGR